jgi:uncharacterized membrane protein
MGKLPATQKTQSNATESDVGSSNLATIEDLIERELKGKVQSRDLSVVTSRITQIVVSEQFSGPMPHPKHLAAYDQILPGAAERILGMAEKNLKHNIDSNAKILDAEIDDTKRGMYLGFVALALLICGAFGALFVTESEVVPGLFLTAVAIGAVGVFVKGRKG